MKAHTRRRRFLVVLGLLGVALTLSGCGQKGPLYFPESDAQKKDKSGSTS